MLAPLHKAASFIRKKGFSFFAVFMGCFLLVHLVWVTYLVFNFRYWFQADKDMNPYVVVTYLIISPIVLVIFLSIPPYIIYEKARHKAWLYVCPLALLGLAVWYVVSRFGWYQTDELIASAVLPGLYSLDIFIASRLSAPPEREDSNIIENRHENNS